MKNQSIHVILLLCIISSATAGIKNGEIPYPQALDKASVVQSRIDDINKNGLVIGNGDLNALVHSSADCIILTVSKNDVWDSRMNTSEDPPLPTIDVRGRKWTGKEGAPNSWNKNKYPIQVPCGRVLISSDKEINNTKLDLRKAKVSIDSGKTSTVVRTLWQSNVFLIGEN